MMTRVFSAASCGTDCFDDLGYRGWFMQPYRAALRYGYWRGDRRTSSGNRRHDAIVT